MMVLQLPVHLEWDQWLLKPPIGASFFFVVEPPQYFGQLADWGRLSYWRFLSLPAKKKMETCFWECRAQASKQTCAKPLSWKLVCRLPFFVSWKAKFVSGSQERQVITKDALSSRRNSEGFPFSLKCPGLWCFRAENYQILCRKWFSELPPQPSSVLNWLNCLPLRRFLVERAVFWWREAERRVGENFDRNQSPVWM